MVKKEVLSILRYLFCLIMGILLISSCASIGVGPQGGPKDSIPPKVLQMLPENLTRNFKAEKIVIQFDEYFKLNDQAKQFSISPDVDILPTLKIKDKSLEITFADTLEKNTTYTLNFGKSIVDINESNPLPNFSYVFATGPELDSLNISGTIKNALTGEPEFEAVALVIPLSRDTLFSKRKASIYALTDSSGNFRIKNLKADTYKVYAILEKSSDKIYQQSTDEVGFLKDPLVLTKDTAHINMVVFKEEASVFRVNDRRINADGSISISYNMKLKKPGITFTEPANVDAGKKFKFNATGDTVKVWLNDLSFDSTKVSITDSGKVLQTIKLTKGKKETYTRSVIPTDNLEGNLLNPNKTLKLTFPLPIQALELKKITLMEDSVVQENFTVEKDSADFLSYLVKYPWRPSSIYEIKFDEGAFTAIFDAKNKLFTKKFELGKYDDYGTLAVKIITPEPNKQYVLEVVNEAKATVNKLVVSRDTSVTFTKYKAGKYFIRIIYDTNKNGEWDTGNVKAGIQPENIYNEPKELSIRANWDRNETITLPKEK